MPALAVVQVRAWQEGYAGLLPAEALAALTVEAAESAWSDAVTAPPSPAHRVLVALTGAEVVGFAAVAPAGDPDADPARDAELVALHVDPDARGAGHGSRLLAAVVDGWREAGTRRATTWVLEADSALRGWLTGSGWGVDEAVRSLDTGAGALTQLRYATELS